jgi:CHAT domain-containing protein
LEFLAQFNPSIEKVHNVAIDRSRVQAMIPDNVQVVEYVILPDRLLIWFVTKKSFETRSVAIPRTAVEDQVRQFLAKLRSEKPISSDSEGLYKILIEPIHDLLDPNRALAIIPDRGLHGIPFGALKNADSGFLIQAFPIVVSPTLTHLLAVNGTQTKRVELTAFGSAEDIAGGREIGSLKQIYPVVQTVSGTQVTKAAFLNSIEKASVFHYVGHSARDAVDALRSSILLDGNSYGPNTVTAADIVEHRLPQNALVVLSSCDSSVGSSKDGIGMRGLTSAFLISGAGSVVGSLWPVESSSTSELMIRFHKAFASERLSVADALRKAQLSLIESSPNRSHPYYWSGFVVTGNLSAVR